MSEANHNATVQYHVPPEVHRSLVDLLSRLDLDTATRLLSIPRDGVEYTEDECEIKAQLVYQFYYNELLTIDKQLKNKRK